MKSIALTLTNVEHYLHVVRLPATLNVFRWVVSDVLRVQSTSITVVGALNYDGCTVEMVPDTWQALFQEVTVSGTHYDEQSA